MWVLFYLLLFTIPILILGVLGIFWAVKNDQYEDLENAAEKVLLHTPEEPEHSFNKQPKTSSELPESREK